MSLTGILLDVSASMEENIGSGINEEGGPWAQSVFKVIDDLIEHDVSPDNRVFAIGLGANCTKGIFDVIATIQQIENKEKPSYVKNAPATDEHINKILDILEKNGARNIRNWMRDITLIQDIVSDYLAALVLKKLQSDEQFVRKFVSEFLPSACRDKIPESLPSSSDPLLVLMRPILKFGEDVTVYGAGFLKAATGEDINDVVDKIKCSFLKDVGTHSIVTAPDARRVIRGCVGENELSTERKQELLENVEPFIYGRTPLYESLQKATELFQGYDCKNKLLFVLSDGDPTDTDRTNEIISKLTKNVTIVSCFITRSTDVHPKRLYNEMQPNWEPGAKFLFTLSSKIPTQHLPRAILVERRWAIDVANNETKLFMQVNHPDNLRYVKHSHDLFRNTMVQITKVSQWQPNLFTNSSPVF